MWRFYKVAPLCFQKRDEDEAGNILEHKRTGKA
jgi:hypothetical protein